MLFSIITVCFNSAKTIRQTFDSVLQQEFTDYEYIVVDGASTDGTVDIIKEYEPKFQGRMHWISEPDDGIYYAMNKGIGMTQGEFLNFLNSDDFYDENVLEKTAVQINKNAGYGIYFGAVRWLDSNDQELFAVRYHPNNLLKFCGLSLCHQGVFEKRELFEKYGTFSLKYKTLSDLHHMTKLYLSKESFCPLDFSVAGYRMSGISSTTDTSAEVWGVFEDLGVKDFSRAAYQRQCLKKQIDDIVLAIVHATIFLLFFPIKKICNFYHTKY